MPMELPAQGAQLLPCPSKRCCGPSLHPSAPMPRSRPESESSSHPPCNVVATQARTSEEWAARNPGRQKVQRWWKVGPTKAPTVLPCPIIPSDFAYKTQIQR